MLYVTIPTYNRAACLQHTLDQILPQLTETAQCIVFDNCSTDGTPDVIAAAMRRSPFIRTVRHSVNVGGSANFLRCFEVASEGWIWLLSDDDSPHTDAIRTIESEISRHPNACYFNFATNILEKRKEDRPQTTVTSGMAEFVNALDSFSNLIFITAGVFNLGLTRQHLASATADIGTQAPHVGIILRTLDSAPRVRAVQSADSIANLVGECTWNRETVGLGTFRLLDLISDRTSRDRFAEKVFRVFPPAPSHGAFRRTLSGLRTSDTILHQDIIRYSILAAAIHRYQWACLFAIVCQIIASCGARRLLRWLHSMCSVTKETLRRGTSRPKS